jgi:hypothetical protein
LFAAQRQRLPAAGAMAFDPDQCVLEILSYRFCTGGIFAALHCNPLANKAPKANIICRIERLAA